MNENKSIQMVMTISETIALQNCSELIKNYQMDKRTRRSYLSDKRTGKTNEQIHI